VRDCDVLVASPGLVPLSRLSSWAAAPGR